MFVCCTGQTGWTLLVSVAEPHSFGAKTSNPSYVTGVPDAYLRGGFIMLSAFASHLTYHDAARQLHLQICT